MEKRKKLNHHTGLTVDRIKARVRETALEKSGTMRDRLDAFERGGFGRRRLPRLNVRFREKFITFGLRHKETVKKIPLLSGVLKKVYNYLRYPGR